MAVTKKKFDIIDALHRVEKNADRINAFTDLLTTEAAKVDFGRKIIRRIEERTLSGIDKDGKPFAKYEDEYTKSFVFKLYKSSKKPNLKLTGEMLASMDIVNTTPTAVIIGFPEDQDDKAKGNILGTYGRPFPIPGKARDFFGLPDSDIKEIIKEIVKDANSAIEERIVVESAFSSGLSDENNFTESDLVNILFGEE